MVMDEATASIDKQTDVLIQHSIREGFHDSTLIVIAHRLSTVTDLERILILSKGRVVEFGEPRALMERRGVFWGMLQRNGERFGREEDVA